MRITFIIAITFLALDAIAQKQPYIPAYLLNTNTVDGQQFTWDKTAASENFLIIWGDSVGLEPANHSDPSLRFDPDQILDTLEHIYSIFKDLGFALDSPGTKLNQYKIPVVMYNTWGFNGATGWANGGDADGIIGAFWVHPLAMHGGHVAAHELTHSLQAQSVIDYRTTNVYGPVWLNAGIFWETHANFMRNILYPQDVTAWGMDVYHIETWGDWKNTYENYPLLFAIMESDGIGIINRMWNESSPVEYPLQAYKRLSDYNQGPFNDKMFEHVRRMATYDFPFNHVGDYFRQYRRNDLMYYLPSVQATYTILQRDSFDHHHYSVPIELAPEEYAYNVIPIYPDPDSCAVIIRFKGHFEANFHGGWRYGFVAANQDGKVSRYGEMQKAYDSIVSFSLEGDEAYMYFVVMGAPFDTIQTGKTNDTWHGYPKKFRYPYDLSISGGVPEGFQPPDEFRSQLKLNGHLHPNGGGWVSNSASVENTVYVAPSATVLGNSIITGTVKILNTALVRDAIISADVIVEHNAFVDGGWYRDNAIIRGQAFAENDSVWGNAEINMRAKVSNYKLAGDIEVGGDVVVYNNTGYCDNGVYYRMTNYYQDNLLECDGRTATHPANKDVNNPITPFTSAQMNINCSCDQFPDCFTTAIDDYTLEANMYSLYPNPASDLVTLKSTEESSHPVTISVYNLLGEYISTHQLASSWNIDVSGYAPGIYLVKVAEEGKKAGILRLMVR